MMPYLLLSAMVLMRASLTRGKDDASFKHWVGVIQCIRTYSAHMN